MVQKRESCNWWCPWELFLLSVYVCAHKRECLLSCAKSGFNPALSFSSSYLFPSAATFQVFGTGLAEGIFQRSGRSDGRAQLWRHGGNGTTASHWAFCFVPKGSCREALMGPDEAVGEATASLPPLWPPLPPLVGPVLVQDVVEWPTFHTQPLSQWGGGWFL